MWPCPIPEERLRRVEDALRKANPKAAGLALSVQGLAGSIAVDLSDNPELRDISPLRGLPIAELNLDRTDVRDLGPLEGMAIGWLQASSVSGAEVALTDLTPLTGMPLAGVTLNYHRGIRDISALSAAPLRMVQLGETQIVSLEPLAGKALEILSLGGSASHPTAVRTIEALRGMPLKTVNLFNCLYLSDLQPLASCKDLEILWTPRHLPPLPQELTGGLPKLKYVNPSGEQLTTVVYPHMFDLMRGIHERWRNSLQATADETLPGTQTTASPLSLGTVAKAILTGRTDDATKLWQDRTEEVKRNAAEGPVDAQLRALAQIDRQILASFGPDIGKTVEIRLVKETLTCEVRAVTDDGLEVAIPVRRGRTTGRVGRTLHYGDLAVQEKLRRLGSGDTPELNLQRGLLALEVERSDIARKLFAKAGGPLADALVAELDRREGVAADSIEPGRNWTVPDLGMEFVWVKALDMWVGKYEVTNAEYRAFRPEHESPDSRDSRLNGDRQPVVYINFDDACNYAAWLIGRESGTGRLPKHLIYRLPTEAEWMVFAQCGGTRKYPWGNEWPPRYGNFAGQEAVVTKQRLTDYRDDWPGSCPVEQSGENEWGLFGVAGNAWEVTAREPAEKQSFSRWLGGAWGSGREETLRCTYRGDGGGNDRVSTYGFRLALAPKPGMSESGEIALFDGTTLDAWTLPPGGSWRITGGLLHAPGSERGELWTKQTFVNYELELDFRIEKRANSGIFLNERTQPLKNAATFGIEVQICDRGSGGRTACGGIYGRREPGRDAARSAGEWNHYRIVWHNGRVQVELNGVEVVDAVVLTAEETRTIQEQAQLNGVKSVGTQLPPGRIGLQKHAGQVWFRNIRLRELPD
jgi:hypothetical protein